MRKREIERKMKYGDLKNAALLNLPYRRYEQEAIQCEFNEEGCLIVKSHTRGKHKYHHISREGKQWLLHRWIFYINNNYIPEVVMHTCDNTDCINPMHLIAGTHQLNDLDRIKKGRSAKGEKNGTAKLTEKKVSKIKELLRKGKSTYFISKRFGVSSAAIHLIKIGKNWKHVQ